MNKTLKLLLVLFLGTTVTIKAQRAGDYNSSAKTSVENEMIGDNFIVAAMDSLSTLKYFESSENTKCLLNENK